LGLLFKAKSRAFRFFVVLYRWTNLGGALMTGQGFDDD